LSDALCRLSTGGGFSTRTLYENDEETIFDAKRPVAITGIEELATRGDLLDRSVIVTLPTIPEERRRPEAAIWREFDEARPRLLGVLYDAVSVALRNLPKTTVPGLPRMADFTLWATAAEPALGLKTGEFLASYAGNRTAANELAIEASPIGKVLLDFMATTTYWTGTASELLAELDARVDEKANRQRGWPQTGRALSGALKRLAPNLRAVGLRVDFGSSGRGKGKRRNLTLGRIGENTVPTVPTVPNPEKQGSSGVDGDANGVDGDAVGTQNGGDVNPCSTTAGTHGDGGDAKVPPYSNGVQLELTADQDAAVDQFLRS
jgi:hypothetical protein